MPHAEQRGGSLPRAAAVRVDETLPLFGGRQQGGAAHCQQARIAIECSHWPTGLACTLLVNVHCTLLVSVHCSSSVTPSAQACREAVPA